MGIIRVSQCLAILDGESNENLCVRLRLCNCCLWDVVCTPSSLTLQFFGDNTFTASLPHVRTQTLFYSSGQFLYQLDRQLGPGCYERRTFGPRTGKLPSRVFDNRGLRLFRPRDTTPSTLGAPLSVIILPDCVRHVSRRPVLTFTQPLLTLCYALTELPAKSLNQS